MRHLVLLLAFGLAVVGTAVPAQEGRIVGGTEVSITQYPHLVAMLFANDMVTFTQFCGGNIVNLRSIITAAHCIFGNVLAQYRIRAGSSYAHSGGTQYQISEYSVHPDYEVVNYLTYVNDIAILRVEGFITYIPGVVGAAAFASSNYYLGDNQPVWTAGWGRTAFTEPASEVLRHVEIYTVNHEECVRRFDTINRVVTDGMVCAGVLDVGGRDQCYGDGGGPLQHHGVVVAIVSWGHECANPFFPGVNARVSNFADWINANA